MKEKSSDRSFGILFSIVFLIITFWPVISSKQPYYWFLVPSIIFIAIAILKPKFLAPLNKLWIRFGNVLGAVIAPLVMAIIFFVVLTPIGLLMKIIGKDLLKVKFYKKINSYWIKRDNIKSMKKQF
jgi:hypothetical protein|tara:strand:- start:116 stop:493 length:378 start_codon:yes stop_codon:yes gene_type:complete